MKVKISRFLMVAGAWMIFMAFVSHLFREQLPLPSDYAVVLIVGSLLLWTFALFDLDIEE